MPDKKKSAAWRGVFLDSFLVRNVVLVQAIGICPVVAAATTLKSGVALAVCTTLVLVPISLCMALIGNRLSAWLRPVVYTLMASVLLMGASVAVDRWVSEALFAKLYLFLPLMAVNTILTYRVGGFAANHHPVTALVDALGSALGFSLVICLTAALREIAATACLWEIPLGYHLTFREAEQPFAGFVVLAFMAAFLQWAKSRRALRGQPDRGEDLL